MVEQVGLEPTTTRLWAEGSNQLSYCSKWWLRGESNPRHSGYEPPALPTELRSQSKIDIKTELRKKQEETYLITINYAVSLKITLKSGPLQTKYKKNKEVSFLGNFLFCVSNKNQELLLQIYLSSLCQNKKRIL